MPDTTTTTTEFPVEEKLEPIFVQEINPEGAQSEAS